MRGINIFLADGFEDCEALATNDVLRRGGLKTRLVSISDEPFVASSHGITVGVEDFLDELLEEGHSGTGASDVMIFPGGMPGSKNLAKCGKLIKAMREHYAAGGTVAAICAAPGLVLSQLDIPQGLEFTCFEGFEDALIAKGGRYTPLPAVTDGRIITGRSAGHAVAFALQILSKVKDDQAAAEVRHAMYLD